MTGNIAENLLSITSRVEVPFIIVKIADFTFGTYTMNKDINGFNVDFPNYIKSLDIKKNANGIVNEYTLQMDYAITPKDDPNFIEKLLSKAKKDRRITFSYGDYNVPNFIYREEEALIIKVSPSVNVNNGVIRYTIKAVSNSYKQLETLYSFPERKGVKPSKIIKELLFSSKYKLTDIFYGMRTLDLVNKANFIADDDMLVDLEYKSNICVLDYIKYLVKCMRWVNESSDNTTGLKTCVYKFAVYDDIGSEFGGPYFKVVRYSSAGELIDLDSLNHVNIDIGYPGTNSVIAFNVENTDAYTLLYDYNGELNKDSYKYDIDSEGKISYITTDGLLESKMLDKVTEEERNWWSQVTAYPLVASITVRGLLRNILLMSKVKINVLFYGKKHIYSGVYIINNQKDSISSGGYRTTLTLIRVGGVEI